MTDDGVYLALSNPLGPYTKIYMLSQNKYVELGTGVHKALAQPTGIQADPSALTFSPNGRYLAVSSADGNTEVKLWRLNSDNSFTALNSLTLTSIGQSTVLRFSSDSKYLAITSDGYLYIYSIDVGDVFLKANVQWLGSYSDFVPYPIEDIGFTQNAGSLILSSGYSVGLTMPVDRFAPDNWGTYSPLQIYTTNTNGTHEMGMPH
jgi:WD40 repeat protein